MKKSIILVSLSLLVLLSGCDNTRKVGKTIESGRFIVSNSEYFATTLGIDYVIVLTDKQTGVEYLAVNRAGHIALTPLLKNP